MTDKGQGVCGLSIIVALIAIAATIAFSGCALKTPLMQNDLQLAKIPINVDKIENKLDKLGVDFKAQAAVLAGVGNSIKDLKISAGRDAFYNDPRPLQVMVLGLVAIIIVGGLIGAAVLIFLFIFFRKVINMFIKSKSSVLKMVLALMKHKKKRG